jgi:DNA repair exonuclease SbcCD ATPase subunit
MPDAKDGAYLAHISDTVTSIAAQLDECKEVQQNMLAVLGQLLDVNQTQSEMLAEIMTAASQDAGPSPVGEALEALATSIRELDEHQALLITHVTELPDAIGKQFEISLRDRRAADATQN